ncbi:hypothetical protein Zmor_022474 [Zophobas morio]|uniref:Mab-21-like nucleotidyltransferase domain-containing protein n=1 Tax=Zophobas morio TaxID=2755281 RepID=A0AA38M6C7_9CUCU|nr:hypothetical protein Zmor_022474 [Zophobas morio]
MEHNLHEINRTFINLPEWMVYTNNEIIGDVVPRFIDTMKQQDPLFDAMFRRVFYGGSYYDGLKVGDPGEFDLDLLLDLPRYAQPELVDSIYPGFVQVQVNRLDAWMRQPEALPSYSNFGRLLDDNRHVNTDKVLSWMEGLVQRSLNNFVAGNSLRVTFSKSGPALTLHIIAPTTKMDVDLVPCFVFRDDKWPSGFRRNPVPSKPEFFVVPKNPKDSADVSRFWRLSFQEQERVMIDNKLTLKPTLKLLKKMRDSSNATWIPSYYIKTMFLHACLTKSESYWRRPLSEVFVDMLKEYQQYVKQGQIPYFWDEKNNLFHQKVNKKTFKNVSRWLDKAIKKIEKNPNDAQIVAKILLTPKEYLSLPSTQKILRDEFFERQIELSKLYGNSSPLPQEFDFYVWVAILIYGFYCITNDKPHLDIYPNSDAFFRRLVYSLGVKVASSIVDTALTYQTICTFTLMTGATICSNGPEDVANNALATAAIGGGLLLIKGAARLLKTVEINKYVATSMLLSCITDFAVEIL